MLSYTITERQTGKTQALLDKFLSAPGQYLLVVPDARQRQHILYLLDDRRMERYVVADPLAYSLSLPTKASLAYTTHTFDDLVCTFQEFLVNKYRGRRYRGVLFDDLDRSLYLLTGAPEIDFTMTWGND